MNYVSAIMFLALLYLAFLIVGPLVNTLILSMVVVYAVYPLHKRLARRIRSEKISAMLLSIIILMLLSVPFLLILGTISRQSMEFYITVKQKLIGGNIFLAACQDGMDIVCSMNAWIGELMSEPTVRQQVDGALIRMSTIFIEGASDVLFSLPTLVLKVFVAIFTSYYLFVDGKRLVDLLMRVIPLQTEYKNAVLNKINETTKGVIHGQLLIGLLIGFLGGLGFFALGISSPIIWGIIMGILAFLPIIGAAWVWMPAAMGLIIIGISSKNTAMISKGIFLIVYGALLLSLLESLLRPKVIGKKANIHPVIALVGIIGGVYTFGVIGFVIGPIILALFATIIGIIDKNGFKGDNEA